MAHREDHARHPLPHPLPSPDTIAHAADVELGDELLALTEVLARHVHDTWVRVRGAEGWTHGPLRDDGRKQHPCLVPYDELPEVEKECDRQTTLATLKAMIALGFEIRRR